MGSEESTHATNHNYESCEAASTVQEEQLPVPRTAGENFSNYSFFFLIPLSGFRAVIILSRRIRISGIFFRRGRRRS